MTVGGRGHDLVDRNHLRTARFVLDDDRPIEDLRESFRIGAGDDIES